MPSPVRPWPYAALCIAQWLHIAPTLSVYVIFRHPMDETVKPPLAKWIVDVDGVPKTPASSAWSDAYTLVLTVAAIAVLPSVVKVEYEGPHADLQTTWEKQWEPWGPIVADSFQIIPRGVIVTWYGALADIPSGWVLCDGNNGTPNLHGISPLGTTNPANVGDTGGTITHVHTFTGDGHEHTLEAIAPKTLDAGAIYKRVTNEKFVTGTTESKNHRPPYMLLGFIMKV